MAPLVGRSSMRGETIERPVADDEQLVGVRDDRVARRVEEASPVDEHADEQGVVHVLQYLQRIPRALCPATSGGTGTR